LSANPAFLTGINILAIFRSLVDPTWAAFIVRGPLQFLVSILYVQMNNNYLLPNLYHLVDHAVLMMLGLLKTRTDDK